MFPHCVGSLTCIWFFHFYILIFFFIHLYFHLWTLSNGSVIFFLVYQHVEFQLSTSLRRYRTLISVSSHRVLPFWLLVASLVRGAAMPLMQCPYYQYTGAHFANFRRMTGWVNPLVLIQWPTELELRTLGSQATTFTVKPTPSLSERWKVSKGKSSLKGWRLRQASLSTVSKFAFINWVYSKGGVWPLKIVICSLFQNYTYKFD